jgi:hypothetical protein
MAKSSPSKSMTHSPTTSGIIEASNVHARAGQDFENRIAAISELGPGWLDGHGIAPAKARLKQFELLWSSEELSHLPKPFAYPTPEGGLQLEWDSGPWAVSAEVCMEDFQTRLSAVNTATGNQRETTAILSEASGRSDLVRFLNEFLCTHLDQSA